MLNVRGILAIAFGLCILQCCTLPAGASPVSDVVVREAVAEKGLEPFIERSSSTELVPPMIRVNADHSAIVASLPTTVLGAAITVCATATGGACYAALAGAVFFHFLLAYLTSGTTTAGNNPAQAHFKTLDFAPGFQRVVVAGGGSYELDNFLGGFHTNESWADPDLQDALERIRRRPKHIATYFSGSDGAPSISVEHHDQSSNFDERDTAQKTINVKKLIYSWNQNVRKPYNKLSKRQSDADQLAQELSGWLADHTNNVYCVRFLDNPSGKRVNSGTLHVNQGDGVLKPCFS